MRRILHAGKTFLAEDSLWVVHTQSAGPVRTTRMCLQGRVKVCCGARGWHLSAATKGRGPSDALLNLEPTCVARR
jgi:hypothetical protein